ncbi:MAG: putative pyridoxine 5'-phosphate oxidase superfamily flavin-nucleotide-binding protein [Kiritimatiellia bacterium]
MKIWGRAEVIEDDPELLKRLHDVSYRGKPRRVIKFHIKAWDRNCPQHIKPRFSAEESSSIIERMKTRIADLEAQLEQAPRALSPR